jgi:uncharacterized membrane protein YeaQ/YmgE (transglycosylase-associated protein family)
MDFIFDAVGWVFRAPFVCLGWIVVGIIAGALARRIMNRGNAPFYLDAILGIAGAVVGGFALSLFARNDILPDGGVMLLCANLFVATGGAALLIFIGQVISGRR